MGKENLNSQDKPNTQQVRSLEIQAQEMVVSNIKDPVAREKAEEELRKMRESLEGPHPFND